MSESEKVQLSQDALVQSIVPDPAQPANAQMLIGFLGKSCKPGFWRLYLTPVMDEYVVIAEADIIHSQAHTVKADVNSPCQLSATIVWVKRNATLEHCREIDSGAAFLQGDLTSDYLSRTGMQGFRAVQGGDVERVPTTRVTRRPCTFARDFCDVVECG